MGGIHHGEAGHSFIHSFIRSCVVDGQVAAVQGLIALLRRIEMQGIARDSAAERPVADVGPPPATAMALDGDDDQSPETGAGAGGGGDFFPVSVSTAPPRFSTYVVHPVGGKHPPFTKD